MACVLCLPLHCVPPSPTELCVRRGPQRPQVRHPARQPRPCSGRLHSSGPLEVPERLAGLIRVSPRGVCANSLSLIMRGSGTHSRGPRREGRLPCGSRHHTWPVDHTGFTQPWCSCREGLSETDGERQQVGLWVRMNLGSGAGQKSHPRPTWVVPGLSPQRPGRPLGWAGCTGVLDSDEAASEPERSLCALSGGAAGGSRAGGVGPDCFSRQGQETAAGARQAQPQQQPEGQRGEDVRESSGPWDDHPRQGGERKSRTWWALSPAQQEGNAGWRWQDGGGGVGLRAEAWGEGLGRGESSSRLGRAPPSCPWRSRFQSPGPTPGFQLLSEPRVC